MTLESIRTLSAPILGIITEVGKQHSIFVLYIVGLHDTCKAALVPHVKGGIGRSCIAQIFPVSNSTPVATCTFLQL